MAGRTITDFDDAGLPQVGDFIPIARGTATLKLSAGYLVTKNSQGGVVFGPLITTGTGATTQDCALELGSAREGNGNAYIDLHTTPGTDYDARFLKEAGINGAASLLNKGTGDFNIGQQGSAPIKFFTNNAERIIITPTGYMGIGTTTPGVALHVKGDEGLGSDIWIEANQGPSYTGTAGPALLFRHKSNTIYTKTGDHLAYIGAQGYSTAVGRTDYQFGADIKFVAEGNYNSTSTMNSRIVFGTMFQGNPLERMWITASGNVGIGNYPRTTLDVNPGYITLGRTNTSSEGGQIDFCRAEDNAAVWTVDQIGTGTSNSGQLRFFNTQTGVMRMLINEVGNIGIGTSSPASKLDVAGDGNIIRITGSGGLYNAHGMVIKTADASGSAGKLAFWDHQNENETPVSSVHSWVYPSGSSDLYFFTTPTGSRTADRRLERMRIGSDGSVAIGQGVDSNYKLAVNGKIKASGIRANQGTPNSSDASSNGFSFGDDGDTGMFSTGSGGGAGTVSIYGNNVELAKFSPHQSSGFITFNRKLNVNGDSAVSGNSYIGGGLTTETEITIKNTSNTGGQLRLISGRYGSMFRQDGTNFYFLNTRIDNQYGIWDDPKRPLTINNANGNVYMSEALGVGCWPGTKLHIAGSWTTGLFDADTQYSGIGIRNTRASSSNNFTGFIDFKNEYDIPHSGIQATATPDGGSEFRIHTTSPGARDQDRRAERIVIDRYGSIIFKNYVHMDQSLGVVGNLQVNGNGNINNHFNVGGCTGLGRGVDGNYRLAVSGRTYSDGYRATQGGPNSGDNSWVGYAFGADGDTGTFSNEAGSVNIWCNSQEVFTAHSDNVWIHRNLTVPSINGRTPGNDYVGYDNNTLGRGFYRIFQINHGGNLRNAVEYIGGFFVSQRGNVNVTLTFFHWMDIISIQATQGKANNVRDYISWQTKDPANTNNNLPGNKIAFLRGIDNGFTYHVIAYI